MFIISLNGFQYYLYAEHITMRVGMWKWKLLKSCPDSLWTHELYSPWNSPGQNTGVGSLSLLQEIFPTQGSKPGLLHCRQILYQLSLKGSPRILEWVAVPFSREGFFDSWTRNRTGVCCIAGGLFTNWAVREAPEHKLTVCQPNISVWGIEDTYHRVRSLKTAFCNFIHLPQIVLSHSSMPQGKNLGSHSVSVFFDTAHLFNQQARSSRHISLLLFKNKQTNKKTLSLNLFP